MQAMNALDQLQPVEGMGPVGEVRLVPDLDTFRVLPYAPHTGALLCDHMLPAASRRRSASGRSSSGRRSGSPSAGAVLRAAFENEFSLATIVDGEYVPVDSALCFSTIGLTASQDYADELVAALEAQGIVVEQFYAELGHGQQELSTAHAPALQAADEQLLVRETIRGVAARHGLVASLAPKPWPDNAGNGCHIHFSLWDADGRNRFHDAAAPTTSRVRPSPSSRACSTTCRACAGSRRRASTPTGASSRSTGPARTPAGATTTARRRSAFRPSSAATRRRRRTPS